LQEKSAAVAGLAHRPTAAARSGGPFRGGLPVRPANTAAIITALLAGIAIPAGVFSVRGRLIRDEHLAFDTGNRFKSHGKALSGVRPPNTVAVAEPLENHRQRIDGQETVHLCLAVSRAVSCIHGGSGPLPENPGREDKTRRRLDKRGLTGRGGVGRRGRGCMGNGLTGESGHPEE